MEFSLAAEEQNWAVSYSRNKVGYLTRGKQLLNEKTHPPTKSGPLIQLLYNIIQILNPLQRAARVQREAQAKKLPASGK